MEGRKEEITINAILQLNMSYPYLQTSSKIRGKLKALDITWIACNGRVEATIPKKEKAETWIWYLITYNKRFATRSLP